MQTQQETGEPKSFKELWPWNKAFLRVFIWLPTGFGFLTSALLFPSYGLHALWFSTAIFVSLLLYVIYGTVGYKIQKIKNDYSGEEGEVAEALLVLGALQSPGIIIFKRDAIKLIPIIGKPLELKLSDIQSVKTGRWLPGKYVWGKRAFTIANNEKDRIAFAVGELIAKRWTGKLPVQ